ncbi:uncharacterized protein AB675_2898 [Cyphellophora attinorum]|uniref:Uncharacterized protein n=1 Tax=Cyphellophora attinorum TaxID=1664694 RepID=A0A0N1GZB6_9EURO|nr:uncharacterized protein AB675_2898 [Phialophora attinorum]KPI36450.1 hypothetical protein AB675_2898 [Phialophora attinorum]
MTKTPISRSAPTPRARDSSKFVNSRKSRLEPTKPGLAQRLTAQLDEHRDNILQQTENTLKETETRQRDAVDALQAQFSEKLQLLANVESKVTINLFDEKVKVRVKADKVDSDDKQKKYREQEVLIRDRARAFEDFVQVKNDELCDHLAEWNDVQQKMIILAVKIFGLENIHINSKHVRPELSSVLAQANAVHFQNMQFRQDEESNITELEHAIKALSKETNKSINEIYKDFEQERNRRSELAKRAQALADEML